jgi:PAS domain S-box-containing protein
VQSESKYRLLFECLGEAAFLMDRQTGRVLDANRQAETLLDRTRSEIMGLNQNQFHRAATAERFHRYFTDPNRLAARAALEGEIVTKDGRSIPVTITAAPITLFGRPLVLTLYCNMTERKQAERQIQNLSDELERHLRTRTGELDALNRELEIYSRFLNHDLGHRLQVISESARLMVQQPPGSGDARQTIAAIQNGADQAKKSVNRLLAYTNADRRPMKRSLLDMTALARTAFDALKCRYPERELLFELEPLPPAVGDATAIRSVFMELLANAISFSRDRKHAEIKVGAYAEGTHNNYYVADNGIGFALEEESGLFDVIQRSSGKKE